MLRKRIRVIRVDAPCWAVITISKNFVKLICSISWYTGGHDILFWILGGRPSDNFLRHSTGPVGLVLVTSSGVNRFMYCCQ